MEQKSTKASLWFILVTVFLDAVGIGLVFPILPALLSEFIPDGSRSTQIYGLFISVYALMQFIASPMLGALSDRFGRRPILLFSLVGAGIDYIVMALAPNLWILFIGRIISGLTGASMTVASAYVSDTSDDSNRAGRFGLINAAFGVGFIVGPALGGYLGEISSRAPFVAAAFMNLANFTFGALVLRESLPLSLRRAVALKSLNPLKSLRWALSSPAVKWPIIVLFFLFLAGHVPGTIWAIYMKDRFGWDLKMIGLSFSAYGLFLAIAQGGLTQPIVKFLGTTRAIFFLTGLEVLCYFALGSANQSWMIFAIMVPMCIASISGPTLQSQVTSVVSADMQGELQGTIIGVMSLTAIITPLIATQLHAYFNTPSALATYGIPGASFFMGGLLCLLAVLIYKVKLRNLPQVAAAN
jgi:DHA1 family tetracycline resistance protein-like MFS transporter